LSIFLLITCIVAPAGASILTVPADHPTIAAALAAALPGDVVSISSGIYFEHGLILKSDITLEGATGDPADVVIDAGNLGRVLTGTIAIENIEVKALTLRNGSAAGGAGLSLQPAGDVTLQDCIIAGNTSSSFGGGLLLDPIFHIGSTLLFNCRFENNSSISRGGGAAIWTGASLYDCSFTGNSSSNGTGGGLDHSDGDLLVTRTTFSGNSSRLAGGGLRSIGGITRAFSCTFVGNEIVSGNGGGASISDAILDGSRFESNMSGTHGGGLEASPLLRMNNCEFVDNVAHIVAGGAIVSGGTIADCLFSGNEAGVNAGGLQIQNSSGTIDDTTFENNVALSHGGAFASIISGGHYTFTRCSFAGDNASYGPEGWMASDATITLVCCVADASRWAEGTLVLDDVDCPVANDDVGFGDLKRRYR